MNFKECVELIYSQHHVMPISILRRKVCNMLYLSNEEFDKRLLEVWQSNKHYRLVRPNLRPNSAAMSKYNEPIIMNGYPYYYIIINKRKWKLTGGNI